MCQKVGVGVGKNRKKFDCFVSENSMCLLVNVWELAISNKGNSSHCPSPKSECCVVEFVLHPTCKCKISIADQMKHIFPISRHSYGYCGAAFPHEPPSDAHMQKVIEKMLPQRKEVISMNAGARP